MSLLDYIKIKLKEQNIEYLDYDYHMYQAGDNYKTQYINMANCCTQITKNLKNKYIIVSDSHQRYARSVGRIISIKDLYTYGNLNTMLYHVKFNIDFGMKKLILKPEFINVIENDKKEMFLKYGDIMPDVTDKFQQKLEIGKIILYPLNRRDRTHDIVVGNIFKNDNKYFYVKDIKTKSVSCITKPEASIIVNDEIVKNVLKYKLETL